MPTPKVNPGLGTLLKMTIAAVLTTVAQRVTIGGPGIEVGKAETTHLDSPNKTYRPTLADPGELNLSIWYDPQDATHKAMFENLTAGAAAVVVWNLQFADSGPTVWAFSGFLTHFEPNGMEEEGNLGADITIALTTIPVQTP